MKVKDATLRAIYLEYRSHEMVWDGNLGDENRLHGLLTTGKIREQYKPIFKLRPPKIGAGIRRLMRDI